MRSKQIKMVVMTVLALIIGVISKVNVYWISEAVGRICQFFHWGFHEIFNGVAASETSHELYMAIIGNETFRSLNPLLTMELVILFAFIVLVAIPIGMLIVFGVWKSFDHFVGVHGVLFGLSAVSWIALPVLFMQFFSNAPIVFGFTDTQTIVSLHIWFYVTLLLYVAMADICCVISKDVSYIEEYSKISQVWGKCRQAWVVIGSAVLFVFSLGIIVVTWIVRLCYEVSRV